jgi:NitT/TauT family transport system substrate-binding protein
VRARLLLLGAAAAAAACQARPPAQPPEAIVIGNVALAQTALLYLAQAQGHFAAEGLQVTLRPYAYGRLALASMLEGQVDLATSAETPVVFAALEGQRVAVVATLATSSTNTAVVARRDAGILAPADLAGKRVARPRGTSAEFFLETLLVTNGVAPAAVRQVDSGPEAAIEALMAGTVDAVALWNPLILALQRRMGERVVVLYADEVHHETLSLTTRPEFVERRPAAVRKLLRALLRAEAFALERPEEARALVAGSVAGDRAESEETMRRCDLQVRLDQGLLLTMEEQARWAIRTGLVPARPIPNFLAAIAADPLLEVRPQAVGLIR